MCLTLFCGDMGAFCCDRAFHKENNDDKRDSDGSNHKESVEVREGQRLEIALRRRLQRAKREGDLPRNTDPAELSGYVMTVLQGMAVQGVNGATRVQLRRVAQLALRAWPKD